MDRSLAAGVAALVVALAPGPVPGAEPAAAGAIPGGPALIVSGAAGVLARAPLADGRFCLVWNHSVTGIEVADCFRVEAGGLVLESSRQPDYAAGLGEVPGRGRPVPAPGGGYLIEGIDERIEGGLALRRGGPAVGHRLAIGGAVLPLPGRPGERLTLSVAGSAAEES